MTTLTHTQDPTTMLPQQAGPARPRSSDAKQAVAYPCHGGVTTRRIVLMDLMKNQEHAKSRYAGLRSSHAEALKENVFL
ncbi:unnamed protein product [Leptidea sinapis]|uniref:Uncharacterized protein n=1 Tax=Leptidea sinapis TaxID=189913 RepID=A0A5E4Q0K6_9NEOP|nr:unnamed protein product [Leptidea sinapis]